MSQNIPLDKRLPKFLNSPIIIYMTASLRIHIDSPHWGRTFFKFRFLVRRFATITLSLYLLLASTAFATSKPGNPVEYDIGRSLDFNRSGFGESPFSIWSNLNQFEVQVLNQATLHKSNDPDALLAFYLLASGDVPSLQDYKTLRDYFDLWIDKISPKISTIKSEKNRGKALHDEMHEYFFSENASSSGTPSGYDADQSKVTDIFRTKKYNCISSAMLYIVAALKFDIVAEGVILPSHAFVQLTLSDGEKIEVETTSINGFNIQHNEAFYELNAEQWSSNLELDPITYEDYLERKIVTPVELGLVDMWSQHTFPQNMTYSNRMKMAEMRSILGKDDIEIQKNLFYFYNQEFNHLKQKEDIETLDRLFRSINPSLQRLSETIPYDIGLHDMLTSTKINMAYTLVKSREPEEGLNLARQLITELSSSASSQALENYERLHTNLFFVVATYIQDATSRQGYAKAKGAVRGIEQDCLTYDHCTSSLQSLYAQWSQTYWQQNNWEKVIQVLAEYLSIDNDETRSNLFYKNYESAHLNLATEFLFDEDRHQAENILTDCTAQIENSNRCKNALVKIQATGRF